MDVRTLKWKADFFDRVLIYGEVYMVGQVINIRAFDFIVRFKRYEFLW